MLVTGELPHAWLLPRVAAVVHHGGAGTTAATLRAGIPSVIIPHAFDQAFWGRRVSALGAGPAPIDMKELTSDRLALALRAALEARDVRERRADMFVAIYNASHYAATRSDVYAIEHKGVFAERARAAGLPVVADVPLATTRTMPGPFVVKDPRKDMGLGVRVVDRPEALAALDGIEALLIQPRLENHPALTPLLPMRAPLCTLRVTTTWDDGRAVAHIAYFRIGASDSAVDNVSRGGLLVEADLQTGTLRPGLTHAMLHGREALRGVARAPGASRDLTGATLPHFAEARALCERAHEDLAPELLSLGWDVALCEHGPVLVKCNVFAGSFEVQQFHDSFGRTTREILRRFRER